MHWEENKMGNLTMERYKSAVVSLNYVRVFVLGGSLTTNTRTSDYLVAGSMKWKKGPALLGQPLCCPNNTHQLLGDSQHQHP